MCYLHKLLLLNARASSLSLPALSLSHTCAHSQIACTHLYFSFESNFDVLLEHGPTSTRGIKPY